jgi:hypothetical protein
MTARLHLCVLDLSITELRLIEQTAAAQQEMPDAAFQPAARWANATRRLIGRGFLTEVHGWWGTPAPDDWLWVCLTRANIEALELAAELTIAARPEYPPLLAE